MRVALVLAFLVAPMLADARSDFGQRPLLLRFEGHVGAPRDGDRNIFELTMRRENRVIRFTIDEVWVLSGDALGMQVLDELRPYDPNVSVAGPREVVDRLEHADPNDRLEVTGFLRVGQRILQLSGVERLKPKR
jgi:hypothetical protein